jgi:regulator of protease activity HflC (stomatin/prohibitin superfamily)
VKNFGRFFFGVIGFVVLVMIAIALLFERVPPATIGVKLSQWGGGGIVRQDFAAGFRWGVTGYHRWFFLDKRTHFLTFSDDAVPGTMSTSTIGMRPALSIRTKDNNQASVDVTVTYRIKENEGHQIAVDGVRDQYRDRVTSLVESVLREELAQLSSEEFTSPEIRVKRAASTMPILEEAMAEFHVEPLDLLVRAVRFPAEYEVKLQQKQLTRQKALLAKALEGVEKQHQVTGVIEKETEAMEKERRADWDKRLQDARSNNEIEVQKILSQAEVYDKTTRSAADADQVTAIADGELALAQAEAVRNDLRNKALDTVGGRILLATRAAENLRIDEVTLNSNDPSIPTVLDIGAMVRLLLGDE